jgi:hypothetical protein
VLFGDVGGGSGGAGSGRRGSGGAGAATRRRAAELLGDIARNRGVPHASEVVQGLMMEGLQALPPSLHGDLLSQLASIALVPSPALPLRSLIFDF